ncbi:MAG: hypothetical protein JOS17DRAFT_761516 [Linnemannia elongata]|nr:MAG: hypothetical protein JOS17DRAFT_761516 [Linnemannia elongata]
MCGWTRVIGLLFLLSPPLHTILQETTKRDSSGQRKIHRERSKEASLLSLRRTPIPESNQRPRVQISQKGKSLSCA